MARLPVACLLAVLAVTSAAKEQGRWSRQISSYTSDLSDWVPLPGPGPIDREPQRLPQIKRQSVAEPRILAEPIFPGFQRPTGFSQDFPARTYFNSAANRQMYLQSVPAVPSAPQNYLTDQGFSQGLRFGLSQPNYPLNQAFVGPQFTFDSIPNPKRPQPPQILNPVTFPKSNPVPPSKTFINQAPKKIHTPVADGMYRFESEPQAPKKPQSLQKLKYDTFESAKVPKTEMVPPKAKSEREEVQLLYVPLESLNKGHFNFRSPLTTTQVVQQNAFTQNQRPISTHTAQPKQNFAADFHRQVSQPIDNYNQDYFQNMNYKEVDQTPKFSTITTPLPISPPTTPKSKKLKPHQPPLAIFLTQEAKKGSQLKVGDVLSSLKNAQSVAVLDSVNPLSAPKVFIGPSNLVAPENYVKFELPYLSNIDHSDKKLRQLPFFVAPLSYNTPNGFAKIPFPSPHVGSVVINSQIKDNSPNPPSPIDVIPNSYSTSPQSYIQQQERKPASPATQKPTVSFYSTAPPRTNAPLAHKSNYYSFEPQTVSTVRPLPKEPQASIDTSIPKQPESYFLNNYQDPYNTAPVPEFDVRDNFRTQNQEPVKAFNIVKQTEPSTTSRTTISSTTPKASTYPNHLLETHNPYSINQAFHFSTPLDYHNLFDENYATPDSRLAPPSPPSQHLQPQLSQEPSPSPTPSPTPSSTPREIQQVTEKTYQQSSPNYVQNYSPEIHYESELGNTRYQVNNNDYTTKTESTSYSQASPQDNAQPGTQANTGLEYQGTYETQPAPQNTETVSSVQAEQETETSTRSPYQYSQYDTSYEPEKQSTSTPATTTTTTRKSPIRNRGRPRYTTPKADSSESTTRTVVTRRPLKDRRPLPPRTRYEPNKITTERATRKPVDSNESTTKYSRGRTRGRVQFKPTEGDDYHGKQKQSSKEQDLAYQRDVLHQNYPVTLMERSSTVDIEAITEPLPKISSTKNLDPVTEVYDTENAYSYDRASVSQHIPNTSSKEETYTPRADTPTETYDSRQHSSREDYPYHSRSSLAPVEAYSQYDDSIEKGEDAYVRQTTPALKTEIPETSVAVTEQSPSSFSISDLSSKPEEVATTPEYEITKVSSHETTTEEETEPNVVQTTPSYNRVRVRPGVIRQYHQASSTESSRNKTRRPSQAVTYRPAFDRRRTTMRIEEIEADLKTKQVHSRPEQDYRHPVYRPDMTTEYSGPTSSKQETTTTRGVFRRRRPSYTTTSTESTASSTTRRSYETKNRFRGRRPTTERVTTEKAEVQTDPSTTVRTYSRYTRPRLSERYNKKPETEESDDQDSNYSVNRPKYIEPETEPWSPKISTDTFKPYNPNEISDDKKTTTPRPNDELDIITAKSNDYDDILLTVTPASNNRSNKKVPDIPPTLEALVEQSKTTKNESGDTMSTFETMLEEVMKSLEEQDEHEYTTNVQKHKGGEIGEIPPERIITSGDNYKTTTVEEREVTTVEPTAVPSTQNEDDKVKEHKHRRGFWKKVKVRPLTTETIEAAESQYYPNAINRLGQTITLSKTVHGKGTTNDKPKITTYKPAYEFLKDIFDVVDDEVIPTFDIPKIKPAKNETTEKKEETVKTTEASVAKETPTEPSVIPAEIDLGTGSPDPTFDNLYSTQTEPTTKITKKVDNTDEFSFMDYLFGVTSSDDTQDSNKNHDKNDDIKITTEQTENKPKVHTTESNFMPEELSTTPEGDRLETTHTDFEIKKVNTDVAKNVENKNDETTEKSVKVETSSVSSFMDPNNVMSTSMSTEISHETEICFRGKCIKTSKDIL